MGLTVPAVARSEVPAEGTPQAIAAPQFYNPYGPGFGGYPFAGYNGLYNGAGGLYNNYAPWGAHPYGGYGSFGGYPYGYGRGYGYPYGFGLNQVYNPAMPFGAPVVAPGPVAAPAPVAEEIIE